MAKIEEPTANTEIPVSEWLGNKLIALTDNVAQALTSVRFLIALFLIVVGGMGALFNQVNKVEVAVQGLAVNLENLTERVDKLDEKVDKVDEKVDKVDEKVDKLDQKFDQHTHE